MSGFIDPSARDRNRIDRLEALVSEVLATLDTSALSPEAQHLLAGLTTGNTLARQQAQREMRRQMDEDPLLGVEPWIAALAAEGRTDRPHPTAHGTTERNDDEQAR